MSGKPLLQTQQYPCHNVKGATAKLLKCLVCPDSTCAVSQVALYASSWSLFSCWLAWTAVSHHRHPQEDRLVIRVFDKDSLSPDECLGEAVVPTEAFLDAKDHDLNLQLDTADPPATLQLGVQYVPFSGGPQCPCRAIMH